MQIVTFQDSLHEILNLILWEKQEKYFKMSAEIFTQHVIKWDWKHW